MSTDQIVLYAVLGAVILFWAVRAWRRRGIPRRTPADVRRMVGAKGGPLLLDVRTEGERKATTIKGSHHIPLHRLGSRLDELEKHRRQEIVCYCQTGNRSLTAAALLRRRGFTASSMDGGIAEWNMTR